MLVREVMTTKVHTIREESTFEEVVHLLVRYKISGAPVVDLRNMMVGVISEKDLFSPLFPSQEKFYRDLNYYLDHRRLEKEARKVKKLKARDLMTEEVITVRPDDHILKACALLLIHNIRRLPVVEGENLVGIVSTSDLYKNFLRRLV